MKQPNLILPFLATVAAIGLVLRISHESPSVTPIYARERPKTSAAGAAKTQAPVPTSNSSTSNEAIGESMLREYGDAARSPQQDLQALSQLMNNFLLLVKSAADRPLSDNEDWSRALRGANPARERFLPGAHRILNECGQMIDRWGTPLFFHTIGRGQYSIRSAGPDRKMWTADDVEAKN